MGLGLLMSGTGGYRMLGAGLGGDEVRFDDDCLLGSDSGLFGIGIYPLLGTNGWSMWLEVRDSRGIDESLALGALRGGGGGEYFRLRE